VQSRAQPDKLTVPFRFMSANQACFPISTMARVLAVSKAGYYAWVRRPPSTHAVADEALLKRVRTVHASSRQTYGAPRVHADLRARGERYGRKRIARLMRLAGLVGAAIGTAAPPPRGVTRTPAQRRTWSIATSPRQAQTSSGWPTLPMCRHWLGSCIWLSCWMRGG